MGIQIGPWISKCWGWKGQRVFHAVELMHCPGAESISFSCQPESLCCLHRDANRAWKRDVNVNFIKKGETKENWFKTSIWTNGNKVITSFWREVGGCSSNFRRELSFSKWRRAAYRRNGQMGLNCCFGKHKTFVLLQQWGDQGASTFLCSADFISSFLQ